jgi:hypothetical protein
MITLKRTKTYSRIFSAIIFVTSSFFATLSIINATDISLFGSSYQAGLIGSQAVQSNLTFFSVNKDNIIFWSVVIVISTLLGFLCGRYVDIKRSEYIIVNNNSRLYE